VDLALSEGRIDRTLPYVKREGLRILTEKVYESHEQAREGIAAAVQAFYAQNYPTSPAPRPSRRRARRSATPTAGTISRTCR